MAVRGTKESDKGSEHTHFFFNLIRPHLRVSKSRDLARLCISGAHCSLTCLPATWACGSDKGNQNHTHRESSPFITRTTTQLRKTTLLRKRNQGHSQERNNTTHKERNGRWQRQMDCVPGMDPLLFHHHLIPGLCLLAMALWFLDNLLRLVTPRRLCTNEPCRSAGSV